MDIFLSYAREDAATASALSRILQNAGWSVWWDRQIPPGRAYDHVIQDELDAAQAVIVLWSTASLRSDWVHAEAEEGAERGVLVPVLIERVRPPLGLRRLQTLDLSSEPIDEHSASVRQLIATLRTLLASPAPSELQIAPPAAISSREDKVFVGRGHELAIIEDAAERVRAGSRLLVVISGEPGLGKTRLAIESVKRAAAAGDAVLVGRATEELLTPYQPFVEAINHLATQVPPDRLTALIPAFGGELAKLVPALSRRLPNLPAAIVGNPDGERYRLFDAVAAMFARLSRDAPIVLLLDDLQWADEPSLLLLRHLFSSTEESLRLLVLATYRHTELAQRVRVEQLLGQLHRDHLVRRIALAGLTDDEVAQLLSTFDGGSQDLDRARAIRDKTAGNPLFVEELARAGIRMNEPEQARRDQLPEEVQNVIARRVQVLSEECQRMLRAAAVIGHHFDLRVLQRVAELGEERLLDVLDEATGSGLIGEAPGQASSFSFVHVLVRDTIMSQLSGPRRARLHGRVGDALEEIYGSREQRLEERAHHFFEAARAGDVARAVVYARRAAEAAEQQLAYERAVEHYSRALQLSAVDDDPRLQCQLLLAAARVKARAGNPDVKATWDRAVEEARRSGDAVLFATGALGRAGLYTRIGTFDETTIQLLREALELLPGGDSPERARSLARLAQELRYHPNSNERELLSHEAEAMAQRIGDAATIAQAAHVGLIVRWWSIDTEGKHRIAKEIIALANAAHEPEIELWGHLFLLSACLRTGQMGTFEQARIRHAELAAAFRHPQYRWQADYLAATSCWASPRWHDAGAAAQRAAAYGDLVSLGNDVAEVSEGQRFEFLLQQNEIDEAGALVQPFVAVAALAAARAQMAFVEARRGERHAAIERIRHLSSEDFGTIPHDFLYEYTVSLIVDTCWLLKDSTWTDRLHRMLNHCADEAVVGGFAAVYRGAAARYLGLLAALRCDFTEATERLRQALEFDRRTGAVVWELTTMADLVEVYAAMGDQEATRRRADLLHELRTRLAECDVPAISARLRATDGAATTIAGVQRVDSR